MWSVSFIQCSAIYDFFQYPHNRCPIACPWGQEILWVWKWAFCEFEIWFMFLTHPCTIPHWDITQLKCAWWHPAINTLRQRQNGRRFADDTFKRIFLNENVRISIKISLKFVPKGPINNNPALVQIMAWPWQAIICTNDGLFTDAYMRHSASMS